jgi:hypothetical protein
VVQTCQQIKRFLAATCAGVSYPGFDEGIWTWSSSDKDFDTNAAPQRCCMRFAKDAFRRPLSFLALTGQIRYLREVQGIGQVIQVACPLHFKRLP